MQFKSNGFSLAAAALMWFKALKFSISHVILYGFTRDILKYCDVLFCVVSCCFVLYSIFLCFSHVILYYFVFFYHVKFSFTTLVCIWRFFKRSCFQAKLIIAHEYLKVFSSMQFLRQELILRMYSSRYSSFLAWEPLYLHAAFKLMHVPLFLLNNA